MAAAALVACSGPDTVPLADLVLDAEEHTGQEIVVQGVVVSTGTDEADGALLVLRDQDDNRVQLLPPDVAAPHTGSAVKVRGTFDFDPDRGRLLHIESITSLHGDE